MRALYALVMVGFVAAIFGATTSPSTVEAKELKRVAEDPLARAIAERRQAYLAEYYRLRKLDPAAAQAYRKENEKHMEGEYRLNELKFGAVPKSPIGVVTGTRDDIKAKYLPNGQAHRSTGNWTSVGAQSTGLGAKTAIDQNRPKAMPATTAPDRFQPVQSLGVKPSDPTKKR